MLTRALRAAEAHREWGRAIKRSDKCRGRADVSSMSIEPELRKTIGRKMQRTSGSGQKSATTEVE